jgi:putative hydrolase of the HAD superfamily
VEKPDPAIFERALEEMNLRPSETLHVGDLEAADVLGARRAGIFPVLVDPAHRERPTEHLVLKSLAELPAAMEIEF